MIIDLLFIAIIALSTYLGYRKGLVSLAIGLCAFIISIVITFMLYQPITNFVIEKTTIDDKIQQTILEKANEVVSQDGEQQGEVVQEAIEGVAQKMLPETAKNLTLNIIKIAVFIILFLGIKIILAIVEKVANIVADLPILKQFNKAGGIVYGAIRGIVIMYVALIIIQLIGQINPDNSLHKQVENSIISKNIPTIEVK